MTPDRLQRHINRTYVSLRVGTAITAFLFPFILWHGGRYVADEPLHSAMSYYYHTDMRDVFVGILFAIGSFLYLYKGFGHRENVALNVAGLLALGVALFPIGPYDPNVARTDVFSQTPLEPHTHDIHNTCAILFFVAIAYVCIFRAKDSLYLIANPAIEAFYRRVYVVIGWLMILAPVVAAALAHFRQQIFGEGESPVIFFVQSGAVWVFSTYWLVKTWEFSRHTD
jgi:hypothetical protein